MGLLYFDLCLQVVALVPLAGLEIRFVIVKITFLNVTMMVETVVHQIIAGLFLENVHAWITLQHFHLQQEIDKAMVF